MELKDFRIASISIDETYGSAVLILDGSIPVPNEISDPLVEIFRPLKVKYKEQMLFTIYAVHSEESIKLTLYPSNTEDYEDWRERAINALKGTSSSIGLLNEYQEMLEKYRQNEDGLVLYLENIKNAKNEENFFDKALLRQKCDEDTKNFIAKQGLKMPSLKPDKEQEERAKERKKRKAAAEKAQKNTTSKKTTKKPAN